MATDNELLQQAVQNNIDWCDCVAWCNGRPTTRTSSIWLCSEPMPPFYPNIVTSHNQALDAQSLINAMTDHPGDWFIKDSFNEQAHSATPFECLFEARWYGWQSDESMDVTNSSPRFSRAQSETRRRQWIQHWGDTEAGEQIFSPELLAQPNVSLIELESSTTPCGAALYETAQTVGVSNLFGSDENKRLLMTLIQHHAGTRTVVGYGSDDELALFATIGFQDLGPLSVLKYARSSAH